MTGAFAWPCLLRHCLKCHPNLSLREQPLLPMLDVLSAGLVGKRKARQQRCCRRWPTTLHTPAEHRGFHCKQDQRYWAASLLEQGVNHRPTRDPLRNCRQACDSQLLTSWVSPMRRQHGLATFVHERL